MHSSSSHFSNTGSRRRSDWQAFALSPLYNALPTSPVARVTDGISLPKHSVSISVASQLVSERKGGGVGETQSIRHFLWQMTVMQTNAVQWVFVCFRLRQCLVVHHTLLNTYLAHYSPAGALADIKSRPLPNTPPDLTGLFNTVRWLPALSEERVFDSKPRTGQKTACRQLLLQLKWFILFSVPLSSLCQLSLSLSIGSETAAMSTVHNSYKLCPWHNWANAKWDGWHHPLCLSPIQSGSQTPVCSLWHD